MSQRFHYLDRCRALLMLFGIPYHAALMFSRDWGPPQGTVSRFCATVALVLTEFRMPAFFLIAGFFAAMLLARKPPGEWLRGRLIRLGIPLIAATLIILPLQMFITDAYSGANWRDSHDRFLAHLTHWSPLWISHLWFLHDLVAYSIGIALLWRLMPRTGAIAIPHQFTVAPFAMILLVVGVVTAVPLALASPILGGGAIKGGWIIDRLLRHGVYFLLGAGLSLRRDILDRWLDWHDSRAIVATLLMIVGVAVALSGLDGLARVVGPAGAIGGTWLVLAAMRRWGDRPNPIVAFYVDASLPIYLVHHPIIQALGIVTAWTLWPPEIEWLLVIAATLVLSTVTYLLIRRSSLLTLLFSGKAGGRSEAASALAPRPAP